MTISTNYCGQCCLVPGDYILGESGITNQWYFPPFN